MTRQNQEKDKDVFLGVRLPPRGLKRLLSYRYENCPEAIVTCHSWILMRWGLGGESAGEAVRFIIKLQRRSEESEMEGNAEVSGVPQIG